MKQDTVQPELTAVVEFIKQCQPFDQLPEDEQLAIARQIEVAYYRRGHIFRANSPDDGLRILRSGAAEIRSDRDQLIDKLGEGESFNISGLCEDQPDTRAVLIEDCLIFLLRAENYQAVRERFRDFDRFFHSQRNRRLRRAARHEPDPNAMMRPIKAHMSIDVLKVAPGDSIVTATQRMTERRVSSALVMDGEQVCGIVTDRDFRSRALAGGISAQSPVSDVMTPEPKTIDVNATLFDATLFMTQHKIHHVPVMQGDHLAGIVTASDLMLARQDDPVFLVRHIRRQKDMQGMKNIVQSLPNLLVEWVAADVRAPQISHILTAISDAVTARLIELACDQLGAAPKPFCWLGFGSQARDEQLIGADQDNGLLIDDMATDEDMQWFERLATFVCDGLHECGYSYCSGKVMAVTPEWRQRLAGWRSLVDKWARTPTPEAVLRVSIFFDIRAVAGDQKLCQQLQAHMLSKTQRNSIFLAALATNVLEHTPPLGLFRRFLVERNGEHRDTLDLKRRGVIPIIDMIRIYALANGVVEANTQKRIDALVKKKVLTIRDSRNLQDAFDFIMQLRVQAQARQLAAGESVSNYLNPKDLPELGRRHLRDAFTVVHDSQEALQKNFRPGV